MDDKTFSFLKNTNLAATIFYSILSTVMAFMGIGYIAVSTILKSVSEQLWNPLEYSQDDVTGGYDVLARVFGGGLGIVVTVVVVLMGMIMLFVLGFCISMVVSGIRCNRVFKVPGVLNFRKIRNSSIYKLVINSLFLLGSIVLCIGEPSVFGGLCITMFLAFEVLLTIMLIKLPGNVSSAGV